MAKKGPSLNEPTAIRLTPEAKRLLALLAERNGVTLSAWMEAIIRREAQREEVAVETTTDGVATVTEADSKEAARTRLLTLLEQAHRNDPGDMTPEELEREVTLAHEEAREILRARSR